ncbi:MAG: DUF934 domain-containing protein [Gammaproteobacteria bacterium]|nr:DUF934 domain-containing protein [Gammaproteobacteria bacterium]
MTQSNSNPESTQLTLGWQEWLTVHAVVTNTTPAGGPYEITVVITTDLATDHPQLASLLDAKKVVVQIETFTDGRVFGLARLLRDKLGFTGDLEVSGDFLPDQISFLQRCGVNSFSGEEIVRDAFNYYSGFYQPPRQGIDEVTFIRQSRVESG